jgi:hypothetical protein
MITDGYGAIVVSRDERAAFCSPCGGRCIEADRAW